MTLANRLTLARLSLAPLYFCLFWIDREMNHNLITLTINIGLIILVTFAEISDALDGHLARSRNEITDFGKLFDPFADYVTRFTFFFCFWWIGLFPAWMVVLVYYREAVISFLRLLVRGENVVLSARKSGKIKAIIQAVAIFMILGARVLVYWVPSFPIKTLSFYVMLCVVLITLYSMFDYLNACRPILKNIQM